MLLLHAREAFQGLRKAKLCPDDELSWNHNLGNLDSRLSERVGIQRKQKSCPKMGIEPISHIISPMIPIINLL